MTAENTVWSTEANTMYILFCAILHGDAGGAFFCALEAAFSLQSWVYIHTEQQGMGHWGTEGSYSLYNEWALMVREAARGKWCFIDIYSIVFEMQIFSVCIPEQMVKRLLEIGSNIKNEW